MHSRRKSSTSTSKPVVTTRVINIAPILKVEVVLSAITSEDFNLVINIENVTGTREDEQIGIEYILEDIKITMASSVVNLQLVDVCIFSFVNPSRVYL
jgi:hypothetical protein